MKLTKLQCIKSPLLTDLSPLHRMPIDKTFKSRSDTAVRPFAASRDAADDTAAWRQQGCQFSPLRGMNLTNLHVGGTNITDLSVFQGIPLEILNLGSTQVSDISPLQDCRSLNQLHLPVKVTPASAAALQKALPNCKITWDGGANVATNQPNEHWNTPAFQSWIKEVQAMPADQQIEAVSKKLVELNPGFDGVVTGGNRKVG